MSLDDIPVEDLPGIRCKLSLCHSRGMAGDRGNTANAGKIEVLST